MATKGGLPSAPDTERLLLGAILLNPDFFPAVAQILDADDFSLESHRRIFAAMGDIQMRGDEIDRVVLANTLNSRDQLNTIGGFTYLVSLDDGLPAITNIVPYAKIVKEKAKLRQIVYASQALYKKAVDPAALSSEVINEGQSALLALGADSDTRGQMISEYIETYPGGLNTMLDPSKRPRGVRTGFTKLDEWTDGLRPGEIWVIGARPAVGKTALCLNILHNIARRDGFVVFFSLEMSKGQCIERMICADARVDSLRFRLGYINQGERVKLQAAATRVNALPMYIDDSPALTVADVGMRLRTIAKDQPIAACGIDYFQLVRPAKGVKSFSENEMFTGIAHDVKILAKTTGVPIVLLSQLNRESEKTTGDRRPRLSQCRGAGAIEEIAHVGSVIYREELVKRDREDLRGLATMILEKNRSGPVGDIDLVYLSFLTKFENRAEDLQEDPTPAPPVSEEEQDAR